LEGWHLYSKPGLEKVKPLFKNKIIMPIKIIKYTCSFKCGTKSMHNIKSAVQHEKYCFKNVANKTCSTCSNQEYERDSDGFRSWATRGCKLKEMNVFIEYIHEDLQISNSIHIKPLFHCPNHNKSFITLETADFLTMVKARLELKKQRDSAQNETLYNNNLPF
jgi:hypothetical protein